MTSIDASGAIVPAAGAPWRPIVGLALGAGIARGWAHIGVLRVLLKHGIVPDIIAGTSIGALVGGAYLANRLDALEDWARGLNRLKMLAYLDFKFTSSGLIGGNRLFSVMRDHFGDMMIESLPRRFVAIGSDMVTGQEIWLRKGSMVDVLRASFALPGVFPAVRLDDRWVVDGALVNPVPVSPLTAFGAHLTIAVNLNTDVLGRAMHAEEGIPRIAGFDLLAGDLDGPVVREARRSPLALRLFRRRAREPSMFGTMVSALGIVLDRIARSRLAGDPPDIQVLPRVGHIGPIEFDRATDLITEGAAAMERAIPDITAGIAALMQRHKSIRG